MSASKSIKITYALNPPSVTESTSDLPEKSKTHTYAISISSDNAAASENDKTFYGELRKGIEAARTEIGEELTRWRDLVGKAEVKKEPKKVIEEDEEGEEVEEES